MKACDYMKIGVLTYHCVPNFGAQLQAVSTIGYLKSKGFEPVILNWYPNDLEGLYAKIVPQNQIRLHLNFAEECMPISRLCRNEDELLNEIDRLNIDGVFAGSDAIFKYVPYADRRSFSKRKLRFIQRNVLSTEDLENVFQGGFLSKMRKKIKAVAFSVSSQNSPFFRINEMEKSSIKRCLFNYNRISTRDEWTQIMVSSITGRTDIDITPDPVFAFNQNNYLKMPEKHEILAKYSIPENYVLFSFGGNRLSNSYLQKLADCFVEKGLIPVALPNPEGLSSCGLSHLINLPLSPIDWYALIKYSKGYVGERMHPIVVSLHNAVPFFSFDPYGTFEESLFGLRKRFIPDSSKTYHIIKEAGFEKFNYLYKLKKELPDVDDIVKKIIEFPVDECRTFSKRQQERYNLAMERMLDVFSTDCSC